MTYLISALFITFDCTIAVKKGIKEKGNNKMINELNLIENIDLFFDCKVVLFGAGKYGKITHEKLQKAGIKIAFFCDNNPMKWKNLFLGVEVISPVQLYEIDKKKM